MRITNQTLCLIFAVLGLVSGGDALDLGKLFRRRAKGAGKELGVEEKADEVLRYSTACDKELAKSMVVLEEQANAAKDALIVCREHRETARSDVDFLTLKVETTSQKLEEADKRCADKMKGVEANAEAKVVQAAKSVGEKEAALVELKNEHSEELQRMAAEHESALREAATAHTKAVDDLAKTHKAALEKMQSQLEEQKEDQLKERKAAKAALEATQADQAKAIDELDKASKKSIAEIENQAKSCNGSLTKSQRSLESLHRDHERAIQKISVLEKVTPASLAMEQARDYALYARNEIEAFAHPIYDEHLKEHVEKGKAVIDELAPVLSPVTKPLKKGALYLLEVQQKFAASVFEKMKNFFVKEVCPACRAQVKELYKKEIVQSPMFAEYIEESCNNPATFLISVGKVILAFVAFAFHRLILRKILSLLLLPVRILLFPITYFMSNKKAPSVTKKA